MSVRRWTFLLPSFLVSAATRRIQFGSWSACASAAKTARLSPDRLGHSLNNTDLSFLRPVNKPKLFVHGSNDEARRVEKVKRSSHAPRRQSAVLIEGVDHFLPANSTKLVAPSTPG